MALSLLTLAYGYNTYRAISFVWYFDCDRYFSSHQATWDSSKMWIGDAVASTKAIEESAEEETRTVCLDLEKGLQRAEFSEHKENHTMDRLSVGQRLRWL